MRTASTTPTPLRAIAATVKRRYSPPGESNWIASPGAYLERVGQARTDDDRVRIVAKIIEAPGDKLLGQIGGLEMESGLDAEKVGRGVFETRARAERSAQDGRAGGDVGKLAADPHDFPRVGDPAEIMAARRGSADRAFRRNHQAGGAGFKARAKNERAIASERGIDEVLGESLRLRLRANENRHAENDAEETQDERALAMAQEAQRDVEAAASPLVGSRRDLRDSVAGQVFPGAVCPDRKGLRVRLRKGRRRSQKNRACDNRP